MLSLGTALAFLAAPFLFKPAEVEDKPKADPYSIRGLATWLETQEQTTSYNYGSAHECLWEHYAVAIGYKNRPYHPAQEGMFADWNTRHGTDYDVMNLPGTRRNPNIANWHSQNSLGGSTYGAALRRARRHI